MKNNKSFYVISMSTILLMLISSVNSQTTINLKVQDGSVKPIPISIDPVTIDTDGNITATTDKTAQEIQSIFGTCSTVPAVDLFFSLDQNNEVVDKTINLNTSTALYWNPSNADECIATTGSGFTTWGGAGGVLDSSASIHSETTGTLSIVSNTYTYQMTCTNSAVAPNNTITKTVTVNTNDGTSLVCNTLPHTRDNDPVDYDDAVSDIGFQGGGGSFFRITKNQYLALSFVAPAADMRGDLRSRQPQGGFIQGVAAGYTTFSFSECPGDYTNLANDDPDCLIQAPSSDARVLWSTYATPFNGLCKLTPGKTYYLNIIHAQKGTDDYGTSECPSSTECGVYLDPTSA